MSSLIGASNARSRSFKSGLNVKRLDTGSLKVVKVPHLELFSRIRKLAPQPKLVILKHTKLSKSLFRRVCLTMDSLLILKLARDSV